jgi:hypothetical protein
MRAIEVRGLRLRSRRRVRLVVKMLKAQGSSFVACGRPELALARH